MKLNRLAVQNVFSSNLSGEVQAVKFVNELLELAVKQNASDIHIEPLKEVTRVRLRIDGLLYTAVEVLRTNHSAIVSRIKIICGMDIAEKRLPQDGRVEVEVAGSKIDLRVSTLPIIKGEKVVIRLLEKSQKLLELEALHFSEDNLKIYKQLINSPHGMILLTGPTGSGKSTTLYATLQELNDETKNIITIEDPVERTIEGINQIAVNNKAGLTFATGLRSIVRQDPNIIMVGEVRDGETAKIAVQAALTGHLVLSTLHTNNAIGAVTRLLDIGIEPFLLAAALRGVVAQRLVRTICPYCKSGCEHCNFTGYKGRMAVQEVLDITPKLQKLIMHGAEESVLIEVARENSFTTFMEDCLAKVQAGQTTMEEYYRVASGLVVS